MDQKTKNHLELWLETKFAEYDTDNKAAAEAELDLHFTPKTWAEIEKTLN